MLGIVGPGSNSQPTNAPGPPGAPPDPREPDPATPAERRRWGLVAAGVFAVATFAMWIWMLFIYDPGLLVDELADRTFPTAAEEVCAAAAAQVDALPRAESTEDPIERAEVIETANAVLAEMVVELRGLAPTSPPAAAETVEEWLGDWETHLGDRERYAAALREDPEVRFTETPKAGKQISRAIDSFAQVNRMRSCQTPGDVG